MNKLNLILINLIIVFIFISCDDNPKITDQMLDGSVIMDSSIINPENYLLSYKYPNPTDEQLNTPVIITVHGFSASTFEWDEFKDYLTNTQSNILNSQVLLGAHGRSYEEFKSGSWQDWQATIKEEYERLVDLGYKNISLAGASTACPLIIDLFSKSYFQNKLIPKNIFFIDPIILPADKNLSLIGVIGPLIGFVDTEKSEETLKYWYRYFPYQSMQELNTLINLVRGQLEDGVTLPNSTNMIVYKSTQDEAADPVSAVLIYKGIKLYNGKKIDVKMINSNIHVFTTLSVKKNLTANDFKNQLRTFEGMKNRILGVD